MQAADRELQALLADRRRVLGDDHLATLTTRYYLARVVTRRGRLADARARFSRLAPHAAMLLGDEDRLVLEIRHGAAVVEALSGRLAAAEAALEEIHAVRNRVYGPGDPDTLATREQLVWVVGTAGRVSTALAESSRVLQDTVRVLGEHHPHSLAALYRRIWVLGLAGRRAEAFDLLPRFEALTREVGADELRCASLTAWLLRLDGRLDSAARASAAAVDLHTEVLGPHEVETMRSLDALGLVHLLQGRLPAAETIFRDVLDRRIRELGEEHLDTLVARMHLAGVLMRRGHFSAAARELALMRDGVRGVDPEHPLVRRLPDVGWGR
ncbi:tetratricopeptide repeat protein [Pseudonocardia halophobica]|uniref:tetratricopeptide repeat protein n=1 Tax=Pseudonocardia halophobica TaxID=29401 RepID=UPI0031DCB319